MRGEVDNVQVQGLLFLVLGAFFFARQKWKNLSLWTLLFTHMKQKQKENGLGLIQPHMEARHRSISVTQAKNTSLTQTSLFAVNQETWSEQKKH